MATTTTPAALAAAPMPAWATTATDWEQDLDESWSRSVAHVLGEHVEATAVQAWEPARGFRTHAPTVYVGATELEPQDAETVASALLEVAGVLRKAGVR